MRLHRPLVLLTALGGIEAALIAGIAAIPNLPQQTVLFIGLWLGAAAAQTAAIITVFKLRPAARPGMVLVFGFAILFRAMLLPAWPTSSDDMFRYVWDGRVQNYGISPYRYPPDAPELASLRDGTIWPNINRKQFPTIYPPAAQAAFALIWRTVPDSLTFTKAAFAAAELAAGALLAASLARIGKSPLLALVFLWHPLAVFEFSQAGHLDPLMILPVVAALFFRLRERPALVGVMLGLAALVKFFPAILLGVWWRWREWRLPLAFVVTVVAFYVPHLADGPAVLGFLPNYFREEEYASGGRYFLYQPFAEWLPPVVFSALILLVLGALTLAFLRRPLPRFSSEWADRGAWLATLAMLLVTPSFPWYYAWLLPLVAFTPRAGMLYLCSAVVLAYAWWWLPALGGVPGPQIWIYLPAIALLAADLWRAGRQRFPALSRAVAKREAAS